MSLEDASKFAHPGIPGNRGAEWIHHFLRASTITSLNVGVAVGESIPAYANQGRWVVSCPDCSNGQLACRTDHRFLCNECGNVAVGGLWRVVDWPANANGIEAALEVRPNAINQNCEPDESVQHLLDENTARIDHARDVEGRRGK